MIPHAYRAGWPSRVYPPPKCGRWWIWVGPWIVGWQLP